MLSTNKSIGYAFVPFVIEETNCQELWWINKKFSCISNSNQIADTEQGKIVIGDTKIHISFRH